jgi:hypothetical protein
MRAQTFIIIALVASALLLPIQRVFALTGSYTQSCKDCYTSGHNLACQCRKTDGTYVNAGLKDYTECPNESVANINGSLVCGH